MGFVLARFRSPSASLVDTVSARLPPGRSAFVAWKRLSRKRSCDQIQSELHWRWRQRRRLNTRVFKIAQPSELLFFQPLDVGFAPFSLIA
jgi:hypothetical protein